MKVARHVQPSLQLLVLTLVESSLLRHGDPSSLALARPARVVEASALKRARFWAAWVVWVAADEVRDADLPVDGH